MERSDRMLIYTERRLSGVRQRSALAYRVELRNTLAVVVI